MVAAPQRRSRWGGGTQVPYVDGLGAGGEGAAQPGLDGAFAGRAGSGGGARTGRVVAVVAGGGVVVGARLVVPVAVVVPVRVHEGVSKSFSRAVRARLARDFTEPRLMPRVAAISASESSPQ